MDRVRQRQNCANRSQAVSATRVSFLFAPGAGASASSPWMRAMKERLEALGPVTAFDYPYRIAGKKLPDRPPVLIEAHERALAKLRAERDGPVVLAGKSMGGRIGCHVAVNASEKPLVLVCFGYPLVSPGGAVRDEVLLALTTPVLFVQGTRDELCPLERLSDVRARMLAPNELFVVEDGDHSLAVTRTRLRARGQTQSDVDAAIVARVEDFVSARSNAG
jgi:predicted alpha/beta-hydrolase family hydrolase